MSVAAGDSVGTAPDHDPSGRAGPLWSTRGRGRETTGDAALAETCGLGCTNDPEAMQKALESEPQLKWVSTDAFTPETFAAHSARRQEPLR